MKLLPQSLFGRIALILIGALLIAHALTYLAILRERGDLAQTMMLTYLGRDVAASVAILDRVPPAERAQWLPRLERHNYRYALAETPSAAPLQGTLPQKLSSVVAEEVGAARVGTMTQTPQVWQLPLRLADGSPLTLTVNPPQIGVSRGTLWLLLAQLVALAVAAWFAVRLATRPLTRLARAADAVGHGSLSFPLAEDGPQEVARAARAFNAMQQRIAEHIAERVHTLAAISHDLQTPLTRMRLRADALPEPTLRDKLQSDLDEMQHLVSEGLAYARSAHASQESPRAVDLHALLDGLVCDAVDAGHRVTLHGRMEPPLTTRPQALRRLLGNLIDNALKFGGEAQVRVSVQADAVHIAVCDAGPGIPESQLQAVMQPYVRLETSRSRATGGTGLGLSIATQLAAALGGELRLLNRLEGGLEARLSLPLRPPT
ncbi:MAG: HAMP domain-containing protein [Rhizobacter sp.]|nr:HAMP domain-containing protein [Rhizobacter sp.]